MYILKGFTVIYRNTLPAFHVEIMWKLCCFCIVSVWNTGGVFAGNLLEITSPLMPFGNFVTLIVCNKRIYITFINNLFSC